MTAPDHDRLDGCDIVGPDALADPWADDELDGLVLFADVDPEDCRAVHLRAGDWLELFAEVPR
jgi:hypothetical protein